MKSKTKAIIEIGLIVFLFIFFSYFAQRNTDLLKSIIGSSPLSMVFYILIVTSAIVIAPISVVPIHPVAASIWGWFIAGTLIWIGVNIGAIIAFVLARKYGVNLIKKFISLEKIHKAEKIIPEKNLFLTVLFLRMIIPVDIISYAVGLLSKMKFSHYLIATLIGTIPLAYMLVYLGLIPWYIQLNALLIILIIIVSGIIVKKYKKKAKLVSPK